MSLPDPRLKRPLAVVAVALYVCGFPVGAFACLTVSAALTSASLFHALADEQPAPLPRGRLRG